MPKPFDFEDVHLTAGGERGGARPEAETPFCVAILGDFSGRASRKICDPGTIGKRRAVLVDRDNFEDVLSKSRAEIRLPMGEGGSYHLHFAELDDFLPDRVFEQLQAFGKLRQLRERLQDSSTFEEAADELGVRSGASAGVRAAEAAPPVAPSVSKLASGSLLDAMIEQAEARAPEDRPRRAPDDVREFARRVAAPHLTSAPDPRQPEILAVVDRAIGLLMRAVLHNPDFQALEAAWRATFLLVRRLETSSSLKLYLIDVSKEELAADLAATEDLRETGVYRLLVGKSVKTPGAEPWAVIVGNYSFGPEEEDVGFLSRMGAVAHGAGAPFVAEASPRLLGCTSLGSTPDPWENFEEPKGAWAQLRRRPEAGAVGLALPRFLLRLPYGKETSQVEAFDFEEFPGPPAHEAYLWGNPAFAVALLLARAFEEAGWEMRAGSVSDFDGLPMHAYADNGDSGVKPCAEILLTEEAVDQILDAGLMPLVSCKGRDDVRLARFQSIVHPPRALLGRW